MNTTYYKNLLAGKISLEPDQPGAFRLHSNPDDDYIAHMTAEYRDSKGVWQCPASKRNESWDCEVLNLCCVDMIGLKFILARKKIQQANLQPTTAGTQKANKQPRPNPYLEEY